MRNPCRLILRLLWLASLAACASARPVFEMRPISGVQFNPEWPEVLRTRYQCEDAVIGAALRAVSVGRTLRSWPIQTDLGRLVCDLAGEMWPLRVRTLKADSGIVELWEFPVPGSSRPDLGRLEDNSRIAYQTYSVTLAGPTPHLLRLSGFEARFY